MRTPQERVTLWQSFMLVTGFLYGTSTLFMPIGAARQDGWLSILLGMLGGIVLAWIWSLPARWYPRWGLSGQLRFAWGRYLGTALGVLYLWYALHLSALVLRNLTELYAVAIFPETPPSVFIVGLILPTALASYYGWEVIHRCAEVLVIPIVLLIILLSVLTLITPGAAHWELLTPVLERGWGPVFQSALSVLAFPFGETVLFLLAMQHMTRPDLALKPLGRSMLLVGILLASVFARNMVILGPAESSRSAFPALEAARIINLAEFIQRVDILVVILWTFGGFIKLSAVFHLFLLGSQDLFGLRDYRPLIPPVAYAVAALSVLLYQDFGEMKRFAVAGYSTYALIFQAVLPLATVGLVALRRAWQRQRGRPQPARGDAGMPGSKPPLP